MDFDTEQINKATVLNIVNRLGILQVVDDQFPAGIVAAVKVKAKVLDVVFQVARKEPGPRLILD